MGALAKVLTGTALGAGIIAAVSYISNIRRAQVQLEVNPQAFIHSVSLDGLKIRVNALLKNPTAAGFNVKFPFIKVLYKDTILGSSQVVDKDIKISPYGQVMIDQMMVEIPTLSFFSVAYDVIKAINNNQPVALTIQIVTTIDLGWTKLPYDQRKEITLKK